LTGQNLIRAKGGFSFAYGIEAGGVITQRDSARCPEVTCRSVCLEAILKKIGLNDQQLKAIEYINTNGSIGHSKYQLVNICFQGYSNRGFG
jgi:hypothetical protein